MSKMRACSAYRFKFSKTQNYECIKLKAFMNFQQVNACLFSSRILTKEARLFNPRIVAYVL